MVFGPIMMIIWLVVLIVVAAAVIRWLQGGTVGPLPFVENRKRGLEVREEPFAKGDEAVSAGRCTSSTTEAYAVVYLSLSVGVNDAERVYLPGARM